MIFSTGPLGAFAGRKRSNSLGRTSPGKYQRFSFGSHRRRKALPHPFECKRSRGKSSDKARDGQRSPGPHTEIFALKPCREKWILRREFLVTESLAASAETRILFPPVPRLISLGL